MARQTAQNLITALYPRLSHELQGESNSISNQKRILESYAMQNGFANVRWYTDKRRTKECTAHFIRTDLLTAGVTENLRKVTNYASKHRV